MKKEERGRVGQRKRGVCFQGFVCLISTDLELGLASGNWKLFPRGIRVQVDDGSPGFGSRVSFVGVVSNGGWGLRGKGFICVGWRGRERLEAGGVVKFYAGESLGGFLSGGVFLNLSRREKRVFRPGVLRSFSGGVCVWGFGFCWFEMLGVVLGS